MTTTTAAKTVSIIELANRTLAKTVKDVQKATETLGTLAEATEELSLQIEIQNSDIAQISIDKDTAARTAAAELNLQIKENESNVLDGLMDKNGLAKITKTDLNTLKTELEASSKGVEELVGKAVAKTKREMDAAHELEKLKASNDVAARISKAENEKANAESKVELLEATIESLRAAAESDRQVRLAAASTPAATVSR